MKNITLSADENAIEEARIKAQLNNTTLNLEEWKIFINRFMFPICVIYPGKEIFYTALDIKLETRYGFHDSLIINVDFLNNYPHVKI
jgi:hypothetical protein